MILKNRLRRLALAMYINRSNLVVFGGNFVRNERQGTSFLFRKLPRTGTKKWENLK